jgi:uncharacterized membrane protein (DUF4010 family)
MADMANADLFLRFGVAMALGFLIGLQREHSYGAQGAQIFAGERTLALLGLSGALAALASDVFAMPLIFFGVLLFTAVLAGAAYVVEAREGRIGITTEVAVLIVVLLGGLCYWGYLTLAAAVGIATTVILSLKIETDRFVRALTREDIFAALQFAVITAIVLPILPDQAPWPPPFDVLNPFKIWLMVVLISGIGFLGYVLIKLVGTHRGIGITGFLGGLVSSTAVTLSFSQRSQAESKLARQLALAIIIAWTMMFPRILIEVLIVHRELLSVVGPPILAAGLAALAYSLYLFVSARSDESSDLEFSNPVDLAAAVKFGLLYALILLVTRSAQIYSGEAGVLVSSFISGLADVDAITLSMSELSRSGGLSLGTASQAIVIAAMANTLVKGGIVLTMGAAALRKALWPGLLLIVLAGIGTAFLL